MWEFWIFIYSFTFPAFASSYIIRSNHPPLPTPLARAQNRAEEAAPRSPARINFSKRLAGSRRALDVPAKSSLSSLKVRSLRGAERRPSIGPSPPLLSPHCFVQTDKRERGLPLLLPSLLHQHKLRPFCSMHQLTLSVFALIHCPTLGHFSIFAGPSLRSNTFFLHCTMSSLQCLYMRLTFENAFDLVKHSPVAAPDEGLNDDGQLVLDDVEVAGHGCEKSKRMRSTRVPVKEAEPCARRKYENSHDLWGLDRLDGRSKFPAIPFAHICFEGLGFIDLICFFFLTICNVCAICQFACLR